MKSFLRGLVVTLLFLNMLCANTLYLMPEEGQKAQSKIISLIGSAQQDIYIAMYSFTNKEITKALTQASNRGVMVWLVVDSKAGVGDRYSKTGEVAKLKNAKVFLAKGAKAPNGKYYGKMHSKVMVVDGKTAVFGSVNWSFTGFHANHEVMYVDEDKQDVSKLEDYIKTLIKTSESY